MSKTRRTPWWHPPVFNFNIGNEVATLFHPLAPTALAAPTAPAAVPAPTAPTHTTASAPAPTTPADCPYLLSPLCYAGSDVLLNEFCTFYELGDAVLKCLKENCYKKSSALRFVTIQEMKDMGFCIWGRLLCFVSLLILGRFLKLDSCLILYSSFCTVPSCFSLIKQLYF